MCREGLHDMSRQGILYNMDAMEIDAADNALPKLTVEMLLELKN